MIRVAIVVDSLKVGGAQKLVSTFAANASKYGITPIIIRLREDGASVIMDPIQAAGVEVVTLRAPSLFNGRRFKQLRDFFIHEKIDLVQTHLFYANILGSIAAYQAGIPVIATLHSLTKREQWKRRVLQRLEDYISGRQHGRPSPCSSLWKAHTRCDSQWHSRTSAD
jgi:hypothetical protein